MMSLFQDLRGFISFILIGRFLPLFHVSYIFFRIFPFKPTHQKLFFINLIYILWAILISMDKIFI